MSRGSIAYDYQATSDQRAVPEWMWGDSLRVRIPVTVLEDLYGAIGERSARSVVEENQIEIDQAVKRKVAFDAKRPMEPVELSFDDFLT